MADVIEVIEALKQFPEYINVEVIRWKKREKYGDFEEKIILKGSR